jgi:predicted DNA-binding ribbon-helix-helix protein
MSHRTQIILEDAQYLRLKAESERTGLGLAELVRRALDRTYGSHTANATEVLAETLGAWRGRTGDAAGYVDRLRPGLAKRLAE